MSFLWPHPMKSFLEEVVLLNQEFIIFDYSLSCNAEVSHLELRFTLLCQFKR